jgi:dTDP-4-dehydrorhamnose reductase
LLGPELRKLRDYHAPEEQYMDITDLARVKEIVCPANPDFIFHIAAYTNVAKAEIEWKRCYEINALGTKNMVEAARQVGATFIYMSTDYVFDGDQEPTSGGYKPDDIPHPINWYSTTKLIGEIYTQAYADHYIIRSSFKKSPWEHPKAVADMWTTADYLDVIAPLIDKTIGRIVNDEPLPGRIIHLGTPRKTILELAQRRSANIEAITRAEIPVRLPVDTSLAYFEP